MCKIGQAGYGIVFFGYSDEIASTSIITIMTPARRNTILRFVDLNSLLVEWDPAFRERLFDESVSA